MQALSAPACWTVGACGGRLVRGLNGRCPKTQKRISPYYFGHLVDALRFRRNRSGMADADPERKTFRTAACPLSRIACRASAAHLLQSQFSAVDLRRPPANINEFHHSYAGHQ